MREHNKGTHIHLRLDGDLAERLDMVCEHADLRRTSIIKLALSRYLDAAEANR